MEKSENEGRRQKRVWIWRRLQQSVSADKRSENSFWWRETKEHPPILTSSASCCWPQVRGAGYAGITKCTFRASKEILIEFFKTIKPRLKQELWDLHSQWDFSVSFRGCGTTITWYLRNLLEKNNTGSLAWREPVTMETWTALLLWKSLLKRKEGSSHIWWDNLVFTLRSDGFFFSHGKGRCPSNEDAVAWRKIEGRKKALPRNNYVGRTQAEVLISIYVCFDYCFLIQIRGYFLILFTFLLFSSHVKSDFLFFLSGFRPEIKATKLCLFF